MDLKIFGITFHVEAPVLDAMNSKLDQLLAQSASLTKGMSVMSAELDDLTQKVAETKSVEDSAILLLNDLSARLAGITTDPVAIRALSAELSAKSSELAAAITANTPAA